MESAYHAWLMLMLVSTVKTRPHFLGSYGTKSMKNESKHEQYWFGIKQVDKRQITN